ncbi:MAG: mannose-6-phosphate isomerase, class I [Propionibacteriaceae bacterium]|nr:mannose-6-phosphate isomerase, class I [Propionibacteriaceae bacterium]
MQRLKGVIKHYDWGSPVSLPEILGFAADGRPYAEYWLGTHPGGTALVGETETPLSEITASSGVAPGGLNAEYGTGLPFLLKILAAARPLSLQAHPNAAQAAAGFAAENAAGVPLDANERNFKDPHHKPELVVALTDFEALSGFRDPRETLRLFGGLGVDETILEPFLAPLRMREGESALAEVFLDALSGSRTELLTEVVAAAVYHENDPTDLGNFARLVLLLDESYPGDPSLLAALLLNQVALSPGAGLYTAAGVLHAYLRGTGIEIMAASDNVLRGGLTHKHIDHAVLADVMHFSPTPAALVTAVSEAPGLYRYPVPITEFQLWRLETAGLSDGVLPASESRRILLVTHGTLRCIVSGDTNPLVLTQGQAAFISYGEQVTFTGDATAFVAAG